MLSGDAPGADFNSCFDPWRDASAWLIAVSGGPDSMALLALAADYLAARPGPALHAATVDHGLRPESAREADMVAAHARRLGVPHAILVWSGDKPTARLQERAREARYALLAQHAERCGASVLMTGHHRDDQAETVLFRLLRGSGPAGLAAMRRETRRGALRHARPLLDHPKSALVAACAARGLPVIDDPSNAAPRFARTRLRALTRVLAAESFLAEDWARLAHRAARLDDALEAVTNAADAACVEMREGAAHIDFAALAGEPQEIGLRVLQRAMRRLNARAPRLDRLEALHARLLDARRKQAALAATLGGAQWRLDSSGALKLRLENDPRQKRQAPQNQPAPAENS